MSLQFYPHENEGLRAKRGVPPEGMEPGGGILWPIVVIDLTLAGGIGSLAADGNVTGVLVVMALAAGFNIFAMTGNADAAEEET